MSTLDRSVAAAWPVLFLDFDGVLHPAQGNAVADFAWAPRLADALAGYNCSIVISSTWREHYPLDAIRRMLPHGLARRVVGALGEDPRGPFARYKAILEWLRDRRELGDWRALDDTGTEFPVGCPNLIQCDGMIGFGDEQASQLKGWLSAL